MPECHRERQRLHWIVRLILLLFVIVPWALVAYVLTSAGSAEAREQLKGVWLVAALDAPLLTAIVVLFMAGITVSVTPGQVVVVYGSAGWPRWTFKREEIEAFEPVTFSPMRDFGGWGVRSGRGKVNCINASGSRGVQFTLKGKRRKYIIGSDDPEALVAAIRSAMALNPAPGAPSA